jgi:hypothetical protein
VSHARTLRARGARYPPAQEPVGAFLPPVATKLTQSPWLLKPGKLCQPLALHWSFVVGIADVVAAGHRRAAHPRALYALAATLAGAPIVVATFQAVHLRWTANGDDAVIATRAFDVFSGHTPLVGQWSQASGITDHATYSPGPLLYWLLAVPSHIGALPMALTMGAVNLACVAGTVALARRHGGELFMVAVAAALALTARALPTEVPYEIWNTWAGIFPFVLLIFVTWSVGTGDVRLLPLGVGLASYVVQCDLAYVAPALACMGVALVGLVLSRRAIPGREARIWVGLAAVVAAVCWSPALIQEFRHGTGNLSRIVQVATDDHGTVGPGVGWRTLAESVGVVPLWLRPAPSLAQRLFLGSASGAIHQVSAALILGGVLVLLVLAVRRRQREFAVAMGLAFALCGAIVAGAASVPVGHLGFAAKPYVLTWIIPAGMFVWMGAGLAASRLVAPGFARLRLPRGRVQLAAVAICAGAAIAASLRDYRGPDRFPPGDKDYPAFRNVTASVLAAIGNERDVLVADNNSFDTTYERALVYSLRRHGVSPTVSRSYLVRQFGAAYRTDARRHHVTVTVVKGSAAAPGGQIVARHGDVTVSVTTAGG